MNNRHIKRGSSDGGFLFALVVVLLIGIIISGVVRSTNAEAQSAPVDIESSRVVENHIHHEFEHPWGASGQPNDYGMYTDLITDDRTGDRTLMIEYKGHIFAVPQSKLEKR